ncbi:MAG TPA: aconitase family protein, partial [Casimicrobiaceae bacterium]|nr:aconitase family protein [Casimicrobiaceae bacterium]
MGTLRFNPRILFLAADPRLVRAQLAGATLGLDDARPLRDDISTDEISPLPVMVHFDSTLGRFPYTGFKAGGEFPIGNDAIRNAGFDVVVGGARYGKGSSREHSVVAERAAGIRLVIASSFERIYRQNADNLGLLTSTDLGLIERIQRGETIELDELLQGRDALAATIVRHGGLLRYGQLRMASLPGGSVGAARTPAPLRPQTLFEKIIARHAIATADTASTLSAGAGGFVRADFRFIHEYYTGMCAYLLDAAYGDALELHEPDTIIAFEDHLSYVHQSPVHVANGLVPNVRGLSDAHRAFVARHRLTHLGYQLPLAAGDAANTGSEGISHALMAERYALPGALIVGTDSHTPHSGALGCVAFGVGTTDMANAFVTGAVRITMPAVLRIECEGTLPPGVTAKDLVLHLLALPSLHAGEGVGHVFEFGGSAIS